MKTYGNALEWIREQRSSMIALLESWANINSGSYHVAGLARMSAALQAEFAQLGGEMREIELPPVAVLDSEGKLQEAPLGKALHIQKRPEAPVQVFLGGHMDTVFPEDSPFQTCVFPDENTINGPGVCDLKGGLVSMLTALRALEACSFADGIGWEVLINPEEEIGTPSAGALFEDCAKRCHVGLVYEPSLPDGTFVSERKGSFNVSTVVRGRAAHAGRDFHSGRNAIAALARFVDRVDQLNGQCGDTTINVGRIQGGRAANIVPDLATCRLNARMMTEEDHSDLVQRIEAYAKEIDDLDGISLALHCRSFRAPKPFDEATQSLFAQINSCHEALNMGPMKLTLSGGVCDGNVLSHAGLPTIDTMGVRGGGMHTFEEFAVLDSLVERAQLTALFLMRLANKEIEVIQERTHEYTSR